MYIELHEQVALEGAIKCKLTLMVWLQHSVQPRSAPWLTCRIDFFFFFLNIPAGLKTHRSSAGRYFPGKCSAGPPVLSCPHAFWGSGTQSRSCSVVVLMETTPPLPAADLSSQVDQIYERKSRVLQNKSLVAERVVLMLNSHLCRTGAGF